MFNLNWSGLAPPPAPPPRRHGELVAFGEEPTFSLSTGALGCVGVATLACLTLCSRAVAGSGPGHTVVHVYGTQHEINNPLSTIVVRARPAQVVAGASANTHASTPQVGAVVPDAHRLDYATELFDIADVDAQGFLDSKKLQARARLVCVTPPCGTLTCLPQLAMRVVSIRLKPSEVFRKYGSIDGALLVEARLTACFPILASPPHSHSALPGVCAVPVYRGQAARPDYHRPTGHPP
jgi:hypothetical protein